MNTDGNDMVEIGFNDTVYVRLTEDGKRTLKQYGHPPSWENAEGWCGFRLGDLMRIFGHKIDTGSSPQFVVNRLRLKRF